MKRKPKPQTSVIEFVVEAKPIAQPRHRSCVVNGAVRSYEAKKSHKIHAFKSYVREAARQSRDVKVLTGPVSISMRFVMPRPVSATRKTKPNPRYPHVTAPDIDNLSKAVMDALNGLVWKDDSQVAHLDACKIVAAGGEQPHVVVQICPMEVLWQ